MCKAEEDLKAILDLLAEWRREYGVKYVAASILEDGFANVYNRDDSGHRYEVCASYESYETEKKPRQKEAARAEVNT